MPKSNFGNVQILVCHIIGDFFDEIKIPMHLSINTNCMFEEEFKYTLHINENLDVIHQPKIIFGVTSLPQDNVQKS